jgi:hypothetical protein
MSLRDTEREAKRKSKEEAKQARKISEEQGREAKRAEKALLKQELLAAEISAKAARAASSDARVDARRMKETERKAEARKAEAEKEDGDCETICLEELFAPLRKARYRCSQQGLDHLESIRQADEEREQYYSKQMSAIRLTPVISEDRPEVEHITIAAVVAARDAAAAAESIASNARSTAEATDFFMFKEIIEYYTQECVFIP